MLVLRQDVDSALIQNLMILVCLLGTPAQTEIIGKTD